MTPATRKKMVVPNLAADDKGSMTLFSLYILVISLMLGGLAIDLTNVTASRTQLQVATDAAAHAALLSRETMSEEDAKAEALRVAALNMPEVQFNQVLSPEDIVFGRWSESSRSFTPMTGAREAVLVTARRSTARSNAVRTFLLKLVGRDSFDLSVFSLFTTYQPTCFREGFVASGVVDLQSNNSYSNGFCIHSNEYVSLNSNNYFEPGTVVSMPNTEDIDLPNSGYKTNLGLEDALRSGSYHIRILQQIDDIVAGLASHDDRHVPGYITSPGVGSILTIDGKQAIDQSKLTPGRIHNVTCGPSGLTINSAAFLEDVVIVTDCAVKFGQDVRLENVIIATRNTGAKSVTAAAGLQVGRNDHCAPGGGAQIITFGGMDFPSDLKMFGGQLLASGDINFAANANGIEGASMVAGGQISGTSNMEMGFCGTGMDGNFHASYFRMRG